MKKLLISAALVLLAVGCNQTAPRVSPPAPILENPAQNNQATTTPTVAAKVKDYVKYSGVEGKNALDLLRDKYQMTTKTYSGIGEFVESIGGVKSDSKHFWEFFINGKSSNVGASSYLTKNGDVLEWKLSEIK